MKPSMRTKLEQLSKRLEEIDVHLSGEHAARDMNRFRSLGQERAEIEPVVNRFHDYERAEDDLQGAQQMLSEPEMKALAEEEIDASKMRIAQLEAELQGLLLPRDPNDDRNIFLEIRAGTGGDESGLFAGDLLRMYMRYAERHRWASEMISESSSDMGGYKEVIVRLVGTGAYSKLKFESGGHRVQRVPATEAQGRIHTSACTVAVLPEADEIDDVKIDPSEIRIDVFRASGAGGQHVNKTESAVRITHLPTNIVVECQDDRSQHKNRERALKILAARIKDQQAHEQQAKEASTRKTLIGSGDRSERIRTYNFPQGRVTDHRINLTLYRIDAIMDGDLDELSEKLAAEHQAELLAALADGAQ
ncbi:MAG: peptide chain release factor 1 [Pseudomonadota bacterium]|nr:peptide chain release factor 1 [Burkholderiaceae bacterium]MDQ3445597.1 peptide chain release factor 1 [Pseudomonadota bacterium]